CRPVVPNVPRKCPETASKCFAHAFRGGSTSLVSRSKEAKRLLRAVLRIDEFGAWRSRRASFDLDAIFESTFRTRERLKLPRQFRVAGRTADRNMTSQHRDDKHNRHRDGHGH